MKIDIKIDLKDALALVTESLPRAVPYVQATTLTNLAGRVQRKIRADMPAVFDRPTDFTIRGVFTKGATRVDPSAIVYFPESQAAQGKSRREYIRPGAEGASSRSQKRSEVLLSRTGWLPSGWVTVPGRYSMSNLLDGYGNMKGQYYRQIIRSLQLKTAVSSLARQVSKASQKRAARMGVDAEFFAVAPGRNSLAAGGGWLPPGVYRRVGKGGRTLQQWLKFVRKASYRKRIDINAIARAEVATAGPQEFMKAWGSVVQRFASRKGVQL